MMTNQTILIWSQFDWLRRCSCPTTNVASTWGVAYSQSSSSSSSIINIKLFNLHTHPISIPNRLCWASSWKISFLRFTIDNQVRSLIIDWTIDITAITTERCPALFKRLLIPTATKIRSVFCLPAHKVYLNTLIHCTILININIILFMPPYIVVFCLIATSTIAGQCNCAVVCLLWSIILSKFFQVGLLYQY